MEARIEGIELQLRIVALSQKQMRTDVMEMKNTMFLMNRSRQLLVLETGYESKIGGTLKMLQLTPTENSSEEGNVLNNYSPVSASNEKAFWPPDEGQITTLELLTPATIERPASPSFPCGEDCERLILTEKSSSSFSSAHGSVQGEHANSLELSYMMTKLCKEIHVTKENGELGFKKDIGLDPNNSHLDRSANKYEFHNSRGLILFKRLNKACGLSGPREKQLNPRYYTSRLPFLGLGMRLSKKGGMRGRVNTSFQHSQRRDWLQWSTNLVDGRDWKNTEHRRLMSFQLVRIQVANALLVYGSSFPRPQTYIYLKLYLRRMGLKISKGLAVAFLLLWVARMTKNSLDMDSLTFGSQWKKELLFFVFVSIVDHSYGNTNFQNRVQSLEDRKNIFTSVLRLPLGRKGIGWASLI